MLRGSALLDDADAVDHDARFFVGDKIVDRGKVGGVDAPDDAAVLKKGDTSKRGAGDGAANGARGLRVRSAKMLEELVAQHSAAGENQDFHGCGCSSVQTDFDCVAATVAAGSSEATGCEIARLSTSERNIPVVAPIGSDWASHVCTNSLARIDIAACPVRLIPAQCVSVRIHLGRSSRGIAQPAPFSSMSRQGVRSLTITGHPAARDSSRTYPKFSPSVGNRKKS